MNTEHDWLAETKRIVESWHPFVSDEYDGARRIATNLLAEVERLTEERDEAWRRVGEADAQRMVALRKNEEAWKERDRLAEALRAARPYVPEFCGIWEGADGSSGRTRNPTYDLITGVLAGLAGRNER